ncbi:MAG: glycoside hydrolase family 9 protein [Chitinispirillia bacterium]|nr:glycoside hydrolase family 9 protein [Chitinispirillia bacterium]MCL2242071.1 glycoside hydrolase family 9 protein [Chitinispirillia bacterium]
MTARRIALLMAVSAVVFASFAQIPSEILVDQFGYREDAKKVAVGRLYVPAGQGVPGVVPGPFQVIDESTGAMVFEGSAELFNNGQADAASGDRIWHFDFSSVKVPGRYHITGTQAAAGLRSHNFTIGDGVYNNVLKAAVKTFYYQRAGIEKTAQYAGAEWADGVCFEQDKRTRSFFAKNDAATERDLSGGWFDAGDYNKYTKWHADYISEMLLMYEENPAAFTDDFGIPESGNGVPDILDEVKFGLDWLFKMQNTDGSMLSVQGLGSASPPSGVTEPSYYGPANATAAFGSVKAFAIAARVFGERGDDAYAASLKTAALKAWGWGVANPDSVFNNNQSSNNSSGLAAGNQEESSTWGRAENVAAAAWYLFELTGDETLLPYVEDNFYKLPMFEWGIVWGGSFMDHYRHSAHLLYMRYLGNSAGRATLKDTLRTAMRAAFAKPEDFGGAYASDGYRAFIKDYNWGSNKAKGDYGMTFYKWSEVDPSVDKEEFRARAEGYLHYIHGVNPHNMVFLTNMERYGATRSQREFYHSWFKAGSATWGTVTDSTPGPAPGFLPGGPNSRYKWDGCCPSGCGSAANNARCFLVSIPDSATTPPAKMYIESGIDWPINTWEITENSNGYQLAYIRLLSKFVDWSAPPVSVRQPGKTSVSKTSGAVKYKVLRRGIELQVKDKADVRIFAMNGKMVGKRSFTSGTHTISMLKLPKGMYIVRMAADGKTKDLRMPLAW